MRVGLVGLYAQAEPGLKEAVLKALADRVAEDALSEDAFIELLDAEQDQRVIAYGRQLVGKAWKHSDLLEKKVGVWGLYDAAHSGDIAAIEAIRLQDADLQLSDLTMLREITTSAGVGLEARKAVSIKLLNSNVKAVQKWGRRQ